MIWCRNCGTYKKLWKEKKLYEPKQYSQHWKKIRLNIELSNDEEISTAKSNAAKGQDFKIIINCVYEEINVDAWFINYKRHNLQ